MKGCLENCPLKVDLLRESKNVNARLVLNASFSDNSVELFGKLGWSPTCIDDVTRMNFNAQDYEWLLPLVL